MQSVEWEERESESNRKRKEADSVLSCDGLLWNISVTIIKQLIDWFSFLLGFWLIY